MCGIVGYIGSGSVNASDILLEGLKKLEYRGYDSAGIAVVDGSGIHIEKKQGRICGLEEQMKRDGAPAGYAGIGHTRWATHGEPSDRNSHPHAYGRVTLVHNGIIENYFSLKQKLIEKGERFSSETDTEVIAHLMDDAYVPGKPLAAIAGTLKQLKGSYALGILFSDDPQHIYAVRHDSPLIVGVGKGEMYLASDVPAILNHTRHYYLPMDGEIAVVSADGAAFYDAEGKDITASKTLMYADWNVDAAEKGGYPHFMLKEIYEQPDTLRAATEGRLANGIHGILREELPDLDGVERLIIVACGSAMHAGLLGKAAIESLARIPVDVCIASEFRYANPILKKGDAVIVISQSGETADSLAALRLAKGRGVPVYAIVNVVGSSIAREADRVVYLYAGPEIAVATTKAYSAQIAVLDLLAMRLADDRKTVPEERLTALLQAFLQLPDRIAEGFLQFDRVKELAKVNASVEDSFFIGRGQDYALCMEGSLKLKEISYMHSEAYAAGELKHGTISLVSPGTPCVVVATTEALLEKTVSNAKEVKARGAYVLFVCRAGMVPQADVYDDLLTLPETDELLEPIAGIVPLQYYAYCTAVEKGCDVDKPRNLAKSVTVE